MSIMKNFTINSGTMEHKITVTAQKTANDYSGNPQYLIQVWVRDEENNTGHIWYPKLKGFRDRKDDSYKLQSYSINEDLVEFVSKFEKHIQDGSVN
jgi:hypothetical protein